jgi:hypothetical protein
MRAACGNRRYQLSSALPPPQFDRTRAPRIKLGTLTELTCAPPVGGGAASSRALLPPPASAAAQRSLARSAPAASASRASNARRLASGAPGASVSSLRGAAADQAVGDLGDGMQAWFRCKSEKNKPL